MQPVVERDDPAVKDFHSDDVNELLLIEGCDFEISPDNVFRRLKIYIDRNYDDENDENEETQDRSYIRRIYNANSDIRSLSRSHSTRAELKVSQYERRYIEEYFARSHISFPYLLFIDDFEIHRNMYRSLKAFYLIPGNLSYEERRKITNVFTLTLRPHGASTEDVVKTFAKPIRQLNKEFTLKIDEHDQEVCAFTMTLIGDMLQQADNEGFAHHSAQKGCRSCFCLKDLRKDLTFDVVKEGRYHLDTVKQKLYAEQMTEANRKTYLKDTDIHLKPPAVARLCSSLNLIQIRTYDAPHSE